MWLVPKDLDYHPIKIPVVVTGFGKSSEIPDDPAFPLNLDTAQDIVRGDRTLKIFLDRLLTFGPDWPHGAPENQRTKLAIEERRREAAMQAK